MLNVCFRNLETGGKQEKKNKRSSGLSDEQEIDFKLILMYCILLGVLKLFLKTFGISSSGKKWK